jgi:hypothetical protein
MRVQPVRSEGDQFNDLDLEHAAARPRDDDAEMA